MSRFRRYRPSGSMLVALLALVMATTGSAVAASLITSKQIKNGTIQTADISKKAQKSLKGKTGARGPIGLTGAAGAPGAKGDKGDAGAAGAKGDTGPIGPSDAYSSDDTSYSHNNTWTISKDLPAGKYVVQASMAAYNTGANGTEVDCFEDGGTIIGNSNALFSVLATGTGTMMNGNWVTTLDAAGTVSFVCNKVTGTGPVLLGYAKLTAIKVGNLG
jgi:hypothetical protein